MSPEREIEALKARIKDLEAALKQNDHDLSITFRLTPVLNNMLGLLLAVQVVTPEMIRQRLEIATDAKVAIHRLRAALKKWGIVVRSRRNLGYWLDAEAKELIYSLVAQEELVTSPGNPALSHA